MSTTCLSQLMYQILQGILSLWANMLTVFTVDSAEIYNFCINLLWRADAGVCKNVNTFVYKCTRSVSKIALLNSAYVCVQKCDKQKPITFSSRAVVRCMVQIILVMVIEEVCPIVAVPNFLIRSIVLPLGLLKICRKMPPLRVNAYVLVCFLPEVIKLKS